MPSSGSARGPRRIPIELPGLGEVPVYAGAKVSRALEEISEDMTIYKGVKLGEVMKAVYEQGVRDGRANIFDELRALEARPDLKHRNPGRPRKVAKAVKKAVKKSGNS